MSAPTPHEHEHGFALLRRLLPWADARPPMTDEEDAAFWVQQRRDGGRNVQALLLSVSLLCLLWWPTDRALFHGDQLIVSAFAAFRGASVACALLLALLQPRVPLLRRAPELVLAIEGIVVCLAGGYEFGRLGGPGSPWFPFLHIPMLTPLVLALRVRGRVAMTAVLGGASVAGYFGLHPEHLADPYAQPALSYFAFVLLFSVVAGVFVDRLRREAFLLRRATERQAEELAHLNATLASRVREQTAELRALSQHLTSAREEERRHIAHELHDELGQELTALRYAVTLARTRFDRTPGAIGANLEEIDALVARTAGTTRTIVTDLRPRVLDDLGLGAATEWLVRRTIERTGLDCTLSLPAPDLRPSDAVATAAFRILQESLTNVARHARATRVEVRVAVKGHWLEVEVRDDGAGFVRDPRRAGAGGFGLLGMRDRALAAGGELAIESAPGKGTRIAARLPLRADAEVRAA